LELDVMSFVNPLFFLGVLAAAIPILLHLIKRERAQKVEFPTLMYLRRISKKTIRYQKLRHLLLTGLAIRMQDTADMADLTFDEILYRDIRPTGGSAYHYRQRACRTCGKTEEMRV
jgi:hypothetical protein